MRRTIDSSARVLRSLAAVGLIVGLLAAPARDAEAAADLAVDEAAGEYPLTAVAEAASTTVETPDGLVEVTLTGIPAEEGDWLTFVLTISGSFSDPINTVMFTAGKGEDFGGSATATSNVDYGHTRRSHTFYQPGQFAIDVPSYDDSEVEGDEWFKVLASNQGAFPPITFDLRVEGWIIDNDTVAGSELAFDDVTVTEGDTGTTTANFTLSLSPAATSPVEVEYSTCGTGCHDDATATSGEDYVARREFITFSPGQTSKTIPITIYGDTDIEDDEVFFINLLSVDNAGVADGVGAGTILNDDSAVSSQLSVNDVTVTEGDTGTTTADFTITLSPASSSPVDVEYSTCGHACNPSATAEAGIDYASTHTTVTFSAGETTKIIPVTIYGDTAVEDDETFFFGLLDATNATIVHSPGLGTILNDDSAVASNLSVNDVTVTEGDTGTTAANFQVTLLPAAPSTVTVEYGTCGVGCLPEATAAYGEDYEATSGTLTFSPGQTTKTVPVQVIGDSEVENDEIFYLLLADPAGASIVDDRGIGTIVNDDSTGSSVFSVNDVTVTEGDTGTTTAVFTITLSPAPTSTATVEFGTCGTGCHDDATATAGEDYVASGGTLTFTAGQASKSIPITINGDTTVEPDETFFMTIGSPTNGTVADGYGLAIIVNDDQGGSTPTCNGLAATIWGNGLLVGTAGNDIISGGPGADEIRGNGGDDVLCGHGGDDIIIGGPGADIMFGDDGNDLIKGLSGDDTAYGGPGDDRIQGNAGIDVIQGDDGNDKLWGGIGPDLMTGGAGNDQLHGNPGDDGLIGGPGTDRMWGDAGNDSLLGNGQSDFLYGGIGEDTLEGGPGNDRLFGWHHNDILYGNEGRDQLRGQDGDDLVDGGPDHDYCSVETTMVSCEKLL